MGEFRFRLYQSLRSSIVSRALFSLSAPDAHIGDGGINNFTFALSDANPNEHCLLSHIIGPFFY